MAIPKLLEQMRNSAQLKQYNKDSIHFYDGDYNVASISTNGGVPIVEVYQNEGGKLQSGLQGSTVYSTTMDGVAEGFLQANSDDVHLFLSDVAGEAMLHTSELYMSTSEGEIILGPGVGLGISSTAFPGGVNLMMGPDSSDGLGFFSNELQPHRLIASSPARDYEVTTKEYVDNLIISTMEASY